jgi:hypothetical protein
MPSHDFRFEVSGRFFFVLCMSVLSIAAFLALPAIEISAGTASLDSFLRVFIYLTCVSISVFLRFFSYAFLVAPCRWIYGFCAVFCCRPDDALRCDLYSSRYVSRVFFRHGCLIGVGPSQLFAARDAVSRDSAMLVWRKLASCWYRRRRLASDWELCLVARWRGPRRFTEDRPRSGEDKLSYVSCVLCCCQWFVLSGLSRFIAGGTFFARLIALARWPLRASGRC